MNPYSLSLTESLERFGEKSKKPRDDVGHALLQHHVMLSCLNDEGRIIDCLLVNRGMASNISWGVPTRVLHNPRLP